jgi:hypothetical protein
LSDAAFSTIAYKDSQCLCGFQQKQEKNEKKMRSTTRVNPRKLKIIEKKFASTFARLWRGFQKVTFLNAL